jgi:hypothetical protein
MHYVYNSITIFKTNTSRVDCQKIKEHTGRHYTCRRDGDGEVACKGAQALAKDIRPQALLRSGHRLGHPPCFSTGHPLTLSFSLLTAVNREEGMQPETLDAGLEDAGLERRNREDAGLTRERQG